MTIIMLPTSKKLEAHIASWALVRPFVTLFDAQYNFRNVHATVLKFLIWIPHEKKLLTRILSRQEYAPFLSYGPLKKKYGCNLVSKISQKLLKLDEYTSSDE